MGARDKQQSIGWAYSFILDTSLRYWIMGAAIDIGIYIGFRIIISQPLNEDIVQLEMWHETTVMCGLGALYEKEGSYMVKKGESKKHRLSSAETPTLSRGSSHDVQISPWMSLHS